MNKDEQKFKELYRLYAPDVYRFAFWLCRNSDEAKDITSETFVRVWLTDTETRMESVKVYLFTIARNLFLQQLRNKKKQTSLTEHNAGTVEDVQALHADRSELEYIFQQMDKLPESDREVLVLRAVNGFSYEEIAAATGVSVASVKVKIFRARVKLSTIKS